MEAISREGRKVEGGTKSAKALFLFLPACFERDEEVERGGGAISLWPSTCFKALMLRWEFSGEALSSLQCFEPRFGYMQRDLFKPAGENTW